MAVDPFKNAQERYFTLRGELAAGVLTREQFEAQLKELMVQDSQGRYWSLGADSAKWFVSSGGSWVEADPYASGAHAVAAAPAGLPPAAAPVAPVQKTAPAAAVPRPGGGGCGKWLACGCVGLLILLALIGVGGWLAFQNRLFTVSDLIRLSQPGPANLEFNNLRDDTLSVKLQAVPTSEGTPTFPSSFQVKAFNVTPFLVTQPGRFRVDFATATGASLGACTLSLQSGDQYQLVTLPDKIVVNRVNNPSKVGADLVVSTSTLCR